MIAFFTVVKVLFGLLALAALGFGIYFAITGVWVGAVSLLALATLFGAVAVRDIIAWLRQRDP